MKIITRESILPVCELAEFYAIQLFLMSIFNLSVFIKRKVIGSKKILNLCLQIICYYYKFNDIKNIFKCLSVNSRVIFSFSKNLIEITYKELLKSRN